jgi:outer membrane receptor protein involved in Fe transport
MAPGFRLDGGSGGTHASGLGGAGGGLSAFPKLDFSYVAIDRQGDRPLWGVISFLRPRLALGFAGTQPSPEQRLRLFNAGADGSDDPSSTGTLNGVTVPVVGLTTLGNTRLHPERSRELEGGLETTLWNGRVSVTYTRYNKTRKDAILVVPVAGSVAGGMFSLTENIGEVRNTGTEATVNAALLESRAFSWNVGANLSNNNNELVHLNAGQIPDSVRGLVPGYPLFGRWLYPIRMFADQNHDGVIEENEIVVGESRVYLGQPNPKYTVNLNTDVHLFGGRLGMYATFAYQNGMTQDNQAMLNSGALWLAGNNPATPLSYQAAARATQLLHNGATTYGFAQTVNTFRFNTLSINYELPRATAAWFRVPRVTASLQGSNLGLHTNYRGKDPDINAFSTVSSGDQTLDLGQIPEPRTWWLKLTLGN